MIMDTLQYVKARKKIKCKPTNRVNVAREHEELGRILSDRKSERGKMEVDKPELMLPPAQDLDFIF